MQLVKCNAPTVILPFRSVLGKVYKGMSFCTKTNAEIIINKKNKLKVCTVCQRWTWTIVKHNVTLIFLNHLLNKQHVLDWTNNGLALELSLQNSLNKILSNIYIYIYAKNLTSDSRPTVKSL